MIGKFNTKLLFTNYVMKFMERNHIKRCTSTKNYLIYNLPLNSKYHCSDNKKVLGKMKDEYGEKPILKFVDLKSKMYSVLDESNNEKVQSKGHNGFIEFYNTLFKKKILRHTMRRIGSKNHNLGTYKN